MFIRNCPQCNNTIIHKNEYSFKSSKKLGRLCKSCAAKNRITPEIKKKMSERISGVNNPMYGKFGELNSFYGKTHTPESKQKIIENRNMMTYQSVDFKNKMSKLNSGTNNPMYGKSFYDVWVNKYGVEIANYKLHEYKLKQKVLSTGKNNSMYGKPTPNGSGNGWSGWYKDWYFRSIKELSYMIKVIERFNINWISAECNDLRIFYMDGDVNRSYTADFQLNEKYLIEIKPKSLKNSRLVKLKEKYAIEFCKSRNLIYKITDVKNISTDDIINLHKTKQIKFIERYEKKFLEKYSMNK